MALARNAQVPGPEVKMNWLARALQHRTLGRAHRGMTLLEIMIVLAILALVMGLLIGPRVMAAMVKAKQGIAKLAVKKYANEAYPQWAASHMDRACPETLDELSAFMDSKDTRDPWGRSYKLYCGATLPAGANGLAVSSLGPDGTDQTDDDIRSWD
jgi:prepilin-type N-terminal cleavage/methylation domain-containing protein